MPELPEVETIKRGLETEIIGQKIKDIKVSWAKSFQASKQQIKQFAIGSKIKGLRRRGKVLIIDLSSEYSLLIHLKMTGQLVLVEPSGERFAGGHPTKSMTHELPDKSTRVVFEFKNGDKLFFNDQRKFGWIKLVPKVEVDLDQLLAKLGPEPLEAAFDEVEFITKVRRRHAPIKAVLLDQATVAGVGNIYADEALHKAKIHPQTAASGVSALKLKKLHQAIISVIEASLGHGGTTFTNYVNHLGKRGNYLKHARVFRREGEPCPVCGTTIEKIRVAGRGTHICPKCQKK